MTQEQKRAIFRLFERNKDGAKDYDDFLSRFVPGTACSLEQNKFGDYIGGGWCGMYIGIEMNGYTHS